MPVIWVPDTRELHIGEAPEVIFSGKCQASKFSTLLGGGGGENGKKKNQQNNKQTKNQRALIKAEHLQSTLKAEQTGMKISPTTRAGPGLSLLIVEGSCALADVPAPGPAALVRGGTTEPLGLSARGGCPRCPQGPCHGNRRSPGTGRTEDAGLDVGMVDSQQDHPPRQPGSSHLPVRPHA